MQYIIKTFGILLFGASSTLLLLAVDELMREGNPNTHFIVVIALLFMLMITGIAAIFK